MKQMIELLNKEAMSAFAQAGYEESLGKVTLSNRPDLCEYQCNGAMAAAKKYKKAPIMIANDVVAILEKSPAFQDVTAVNPGFINLKLDKEYLAEYLRDMQADENLSVEKTGKPQTIMIDYGGADYYRSKASSAGSALFRSRIPGRVSDGSAFYNF